MFRFNKDKVNFNKPLNIGALGTVYPYQKSPDDYQWTVKQYATLNTKDMNKYLNEIVLGFSCDHQNVLPVKGYSISFESKQNKCNIYLKMPRMKESLKDIVTRLANNNAFLSEEDVIQHFYALASGLAYLHNKKIPHKDLKTDNILIDIKGKIKIANIGVDESSIERASPYRAPEMLDSNYKAKKGDIYKADAWGLGVVMTELCLLKTRLIDSQASGKKKEEELRAHLSKMKERYSKELVEIILSLLKSDIRQRRTVAEVHSILKDRYSDIVETKKLEKVQENKSANAKNAKEENKIDNDHFDSSAKDSKALVNSVSIDSNKLQEKWKDFLRVEFKKDEKRLEALAKIDENFTSKLSDAEAKGFLEEVENHQKQSNKQFEELLLNFLGCDEITNSCIMNLGRRLCSSFKNLSSLQLYFTGCSKIADISVQSLLSRIGSNLSQLTTLELVFNWCESVTDKTVLELAVQLKTNLLHIESLNVGFANCEKVTESSIKELLINLPPNLKQLSLPLTGSNGVTDVTVKELTNQIKKNLKQLTRLTLFFDQCQHLTDKAAKELITHIFSDLKFLECLVLDFDKCPLLTDETQACVNLSIANTPSVSLCSISTSNTFVIFF